MKHLDTKFQKRDDVNSTWYFYVGIGTHLGTFGCSPKRSDMHILASGAPFWVIQSMYDLFMKHLDTKFQKRADVNSTQYFYVGIGTKLGTFGFNLKRSNMRILASWATF